MGGGRPTACPLNGSADHRIYLDKGLPGINRERPVWTRPWRPSGRWVLERAVSPAARAEDAAPASSSRSGGGAALT
ncbi:hypothetical protein GCM10022419_112000 [Nonomuraea rosea]|uniref:Uncharacterized protein n=1 Tax=Nonomuraea rosea TaxID=638574 RepID=A0ABP6ZLR0_9ACTN